MNALFYLILGGAIQELFHLTMWEWFKEKFKLKQNTVRGILVFLFLALIIVVLISGFYRVSTYENVILTKLSGNKVIIKSPGIKFCLLSSRLPVNLQRQIIRFPDFVPSIGFQTTTEDKKPILITSTLEYQIVDPEKWGVENKGTLEKLKLLFKTKTIREAQNSDYNFLKTNLDSIESKLLNSMQSIEEVYGIRVLKVNVIVTDDSGVQTAKSVAEASKIKAQALKDSYTSEAEALRIKYHALNDTDFIKYMEFINAIGTGKVNTIIVPEGMSLSTLNLNGNMGESK